MFPIIELSVEFNAAAKPTSNGRNSQSIQLGIPQVKWNIGTGILSIEI